MSHVSVQTGDDGSESLYAAARKIYPQSISGTFRRLKWILLIVTLGIYYFLPFLRWHRGPNEPTQAVLVDLAHRRFYFFFIELWPQEVYYFTGLLILAALILFLMVGGCVAAFLVPALVAFAARAYAPFTDCALLIFAGAASVAALPLILTLPHGPAKLTTLP